MRFGVFDHLDFSGEPFSEQFEHRLQMAEAYDRLGFHAYHLAEHHATPLGAASSPSVFLAALSQRTKRIRFGPLVYVLPLYNPLRLIEEVGMLDHLSRGRFQLGVGRGASTLEAAYYGIPEAEISPRYEEAFACLMKGMQEDRLTFEGKYYRYNDMPMLMRPMQRPHPPLWYGLSRPEAAVWAAANDVNVVMLALGDYARSLSDRYRAEWTKLGKPADKLPFIGVSAHIVVADTDQEAAAAARGAYALWRQSFEKLWRDHGIVIAERFPGLEKHYPQDWDDLAANGNGCAGSPETVRRFVAQTVEAAGCNYMTPWFAFGNLTVPQVVRSVELFAAQVVPAFK